MPYKAHVVYHLSNQRHSHTLTRRSTLPVTTYGAVLCMSEKTNHVNGAKTETMFCSVIELSMLFKRELSGTTVISINAVLTGLECFKNVLQIFIDYNQVFSNVMTTIQAALSSGVCNQEQNRSGLSLQ